MLTSILLFLVLAPESVKPIHGSACLSLLAKNMTPVCVQTLDNTAKVVPVAAERLYVWRRSGGAEVAVGEVHGGATDISWPSRSVTVNVADDGIGRRPEQIEIVVAATDHRWHVTLGSREWRLFHRLFVPEGDISLTATAEHRQPASVRVDRDRLTYDLLLLSFPTLNGRVIDKKTRKGIMGAAVTLLPMEVPAAVTDYSGEFRCEIGKEWPKSLRVSAGGYGTKLIAAPPARTTTALPVAEMTAAGAIALDVKHDEDLDIDLWFTKEEEDPVRVASRVLHRNEAAVRFEGLDEGEYELRLRGQAPFERYSQPATVKEAQVSAESIKLEPVALDVFVVSGKDPIPDAQIQVTHMNPEWRTDISTDETGHVKGPLWQQGSFVAFVSRTGAPGTQVVRTALNGTASIDWRIELHGGKVSGTVTDAREKFPITGAKVRLETRGTGRVQVVSAVTDENGQFEFRYVPEGAQRLTTNAVGYVPATDAFDLTATAGDRSLAVKLSPAEGLPVRVLNSFGAPVVGATITDGSGSGYSDWITDAEGRASVPIARGESKSVFVLPREGSMAVTNVSAKEGSNPLEEQTITVPKGEVTIDIRTQDTASAAVADVELLLRHNGVVIPDGVARLMFQLQGNLLRTGKTGTAQLRNLPIGSYEFSPYFSRTEYEQLKRGLLPPGTTLVATPGSNSVILTFDHRKQ